LGFQDESGHEWRLGRPEAGTAGDAVLTRDGVVLAAFRFRDELADALQVRDRVHTYAGFVIADAPA
ncbi:MAG: hypothetical protein J0L88_02380, partial [Xanthomonadales bacterium]|nr:hypothetical protein [Xanthomonadales bacterium]